MTLLICQAFKKVQLVCELVNLFWGVVLVALVRPWSPTLHGVPIYVLNFLCACVGNKIKQINDTNERCVSTLSPASITVADLTYFM